MADQTPATGADPALAASADAAKAAPVQVDSLLPDDPAAAKAADPVKADPAKVADPVKDAEPAKWFYADGAPGKGEPPEWYKSSKYKTVEEQAKAYPELEKRFGAFTGAPKEGKYEAPPIPEGVEGEFVTDHPIFDKFSKWALDNQLSQDGYNNVLGLLAEYEASNAPDMGEIKKEIGDDADSRIGAVSSWLKANVPGESYGIFKAAMTGHNAADVFKAVEQLIGKTRVAAPKAGEDTQTGGLRLEDIQAMHAKRGADGKLLYESDPKHRANVEAMYVKYAEGQMKAG